MAGMVVVRRIRHDHAEMRQAATACVVKKRRVVEEGAARITGDLQKTSFPLSFPYVCPEPALVNRSFLCRKWLREGRFPHPVHHCIGKVDTVEPGEAPSALAARPVSDLREINVPAPTTTTRMMMMMMMRNIRRG